MCECMNLLDFLFTFGSLLFLLLDIVLDICAVVSLYLEEAYMYLGILLLFLVGSSVLVQILSWMLYSYNKFDSCLSQRQLKLLHVFQLGIIFRLCECLRVATKSFVCFKLNTLKSCLCHNLNILRLIETFSESIPQLVLMLTITLQQQSHLDTITVLKAVGSALAIAFSVTLYHRSLPSFQPDNKKQPLYSSVVYFLWNFLLISSRLTALALFASVLPCFIFIHFFCSWIVLFFFAWRSKTDFMQSPDGEWLFRATVGLIWYFNWLDMVKGGSRYRTLFYHGYILADIVLLCSLWYWNRSTEPPYLITSQFYAKITAACVVSTYIIGLLFSIVYYCFKCCHPNLGNYIGDPPEDDELMNLDDVSDDDIPSANMNMLSC